MKKFREGEIQTNVELVTRGQNNAQPVDKPRIDTSGKGTFDDAMSSDVDDVETIIVVENPEIVHNTQLEEDHDASLEEEVRNDIRIIKQVWADMAEVDQSFKQYVSKKQRQKNNQLARSANQTYNPLQGYPSHFVS
ncbi:hypothetical protein TSUD_128050 [Trifolium subterraneum]|nr:hypothetical protein TSUD_128050 [Trifolium subterraneum]